MAIDVEEITAEAAIAALVAGAFRHEPGEDQYEAAVSAVRALCEDEDGEVSGDKLVPSSVVLAALDGALETRVTVHCMMDAHVMILGADWDLSSAIELVGKAGAEGYLSGCAWTAGPMGHDLAVIAPNKLSGELVVHRFDVRKPAADGE